MDEPGDQRPSDASGSEDGALHPPVYNSTELFGDAREVWIEHGDKLYRLRKTSADKLYLTK